ncbi:DUF6506 family protein [Lentzea alba]|uniref:DUF6506 family protein n=1 Tax=Lentzea alba TaxID=2714351 RepID=UPI0039BF7BB3
MSEEAKYDELFVFLEPGADPAVDRQVIEHSVDSRTLLVWVPDAETAAAVAASALDDNGVRLVELYRGFDLRGAARVIERVVPRAPVARASFDRGTPKSRIRRSATIYHAVDADPTRRVMRHHGDGWTVVVGATTEQIADVAEQLVDEGADVIEVCGGADLTAAAAVQERLGDRAPVSLVSWPFESLGGAAAFKAAYEAATRS